MRELHPTLFREAEAEALRSNQDTNDRFMANIQRNGTFSVVPRVPAGEVSNLPSQCKRPVALTLSFRSRPRNSSSSVKSPRNVRNSSPSYFFFHSTAYSAFPSQQTTSTPKSQADNASTSSALKKPTCPPSGKSSPTRTSRADMRTAKRLGR